MMEFNENLQKEVYKAALAKVSIDPKTVLFSSFCQKFNRHGKVSQAWPLLDLLCKVNSLTFSKGQGTILGALEDFYWLG